MKGVFPLFIILAASSLSAEVKNYYFQNASTYNGGWIETAGWLVEDGDTPGQLFEQTDLLAAAEDIIHRIARGIALSCELDAHLLLKLLDRCDLADHIDLFHVFLIQSDLGKRDRKPLSIIIVESAAALKTRTLSRASSVMIPSSTVCTTVSISRRMDSLLWLRWLISRVSAIRSFTYFAVT